MKNILNDKKLNEAIDFFVEQEKTNNYKEQQEERSKKQKDFQNFYNLEFNEIVFSDAIKNLWASRIWGNKDYLVEKILNNNDFSSIKDAWNKYVLKEEKDPGARYEYLVEKIKHVGPSMVTELLCYSSPEKAGIYNRVARESLFWLSDGLDLFSKYKITGSEYNNFNEVLLFIGEILEGKLGRNINMLDVDYFLWEIHEKFIKKEVESLIEVESKKPLNNISRHNEIRDKIEQIGAWLGFESDKEVQVARGSKVDGVWKTKIANLGSISYFFEVQDRGSIDSLIVNLQQAQNNLTAQKLVIVTDAEQIIKIKERIQTLQESFRKFITYWDVKDVDRVHLHLEQVSEAISGLNLFGA